MIEITDEMCRRALEVMRADRIVGYSTPQDTKRTTWGAPHIIRDQVLKREVWRGDDQEEFYERCRIEEMRLALAAALDGQLGGEEKP
jgi:hypothetical protein